MRVLAKTIQVEIKLLVRDVATVLGVALPPLVLLGIGTGIPGFRDPQPDLGGLRTSTGGPRASTSVTATYSCR